MHALHEYVAKQLADKLKAKGVTVWYDPQRDFAPFIAEARGTSGSRGQPATVSLGGLSARLVEYAGSMFEVRALVEPYVSGDAPDRVLVYLPGCQRDEKGSVLMEVEKAGELYNRPLKWVARQVLRTRYTDGVIDDLLARANIGYDDIARASSETSSDTAPSILKGIFSGVSGTDAQIALWLVDTSHDAAIEAKDGTSELSKLLRHRVGLDVSDSIQLEKLRAVALRYILGNEFRSDLTCPAPASLAGVPLPPGKHDDGIRDLARRLRANYPNRYPAIADGIEAELGLSLAKLPAGALGSIDTFRFEERALLAHCAALVAEQRFEEALVVVLERESSFWLNQDLARKAQWEACRRMAELGKVALRVASELRKTAAPPQDWIEAYSSPGGWYQLDLAQRRLEVWVSGLEDEAPERPLGVVRRLYEDACHAMAEGFTRSLVGAGWAIPRVLTQTHVYSNVVEPQPKPVAYFLVDAMRFEMGKELAERLPTAAEVSVRPAVVALPSITPVGMAALQPGASSSFSVVEKSGKLGGLIDDAFLADVGARKKFAASRIPTLVDLKLDELLGLSTAKLRAKVENALVVVVRSQEIDHAGENSSARQARRIMDEVLGDLATAVTRLAKAGIGHSVISADHGHLFASDRDESMKIETPGGQQVDLHRRCWVGRGGTTPAGCIRVTASALGYASDLDFVFPSGCGVFKAGGDLAFHHGGPSLQELLVPVLTIRLQPAEPASASSSRVTATGMPDAITNRIFSVTLQLGGQNLSLFSSALPVRPLLIAGGKQVGVVGMADPPSALERSTGCVTLESAKPITVAFLLNDENASSVRVVVQDPATDAELYRSPADIPVRLGV